MRAMLTLVFVFMLFNLTSIWNLPTISTGGRGHDGVPSLVDPGARLFVVSLGKRPRETSPNGGSRPRFCAMLR
jgi:hypothetical protein